MRKQLIAAFVNFMENRQTEFYRLRFRKKTKHSHMGALWNVTSLKYNKTKPHACKYLTFKKLFCFSGCSSFCKFWYSFSDGMGFNTLQIKC